MLNMDAIRANRRTIGSFDEPSEREISLGIVAPPLQGDHFELKPSILRFIERSTFKGSAIECPLEHLDRFERLCRTLLRNGENDGALRMMLFPHSLQDKGAYWERTIPSNKVSTWDMVKKEFLRKFFPKQRTRKFRYEIQSFQQKGDESLSEAWDRFGGLIRGCPHHGMSKENLFGIFYRGVHNDIRRDFDIAAYGSFASLDVEQAETLIENMAQSEACLGDDSDRRSSKNVASIEDEKYVDFRRDICKEIESKLCEKFDKFSRLLLDQQSYPQAINQPQARPQWFNNNFQGQGFNQASPLHHQQMNLPQDNNLQGRNFQGNVQQAQGSSSQDNETHTMLKAIMDGLAQSHVTNLETQTQVRELQRQIVEMQAKIDRMEYQNAQASSSSKQPMVSSSSKSEATLKGHCNEIHQSHIDKVQLEENEKFLEDFAKHIASPIEEKISKGGNGNEFKGKSSNMEMEPPKVKNVAKVEKELQEKPRVEIEKKAKPTKKKVDPMRDQRTSNEPNPPSLTLKPLMVVNGKLECDVKSSNGIKPFAKANVVLKSPSLLIECGMLSEAMAKAFGMKLKDRGPTLSSGFIPCICA